MTKRIKTGGRQKGTPNKTTAAMKEAITQLIAHYQDSGQMAEDLLSIDDPRERLLTACRLMEYVMPKMRSVESDIKVSDEGAQTLRDHLRALSDAGAKR